MSIPAKAFHCSHCTTRTGRYKLYSESAIRKHERICFENPETKSCGSCCFHGYGMIDGKSVRICAMEPDAVLTIPRCRLWTAKPEEDQEPFEFPTPEEFKKLRKDEQRSTFLKFMAAFGMERPEAEGDRP